MAAATTAASPVTLLYVEFGLYMSWNEPLLTSICSATAATLLLPVLAAPPPPAVASRASAAALAVTPALPPATSVVAPTTLPVTARLRP